MYTKISFSRKQIKKAIFWLSHSDLNVKSKNIGSDNNVFFPRQKVFFNRIQKNANTLALAYLYEAVRGEVPANMTNDLLKKETLNIHDLTFGEIKQVRNYYSFFIARNPYSRILSGFLQKIAPRDTSPNYRIFGGCGDDSPRGFENFLLSLSKNKLLFRNRHFQPQTSLLLFSVPNYNKIFYFENLSDLSAMLANKFHCNSLRDLPYGSLHKIEPRRKFTNASNLLASYYTESSAELVSMLYSDDFEKLGYTHNLRVT